MNKSSLFIAFALVALLFGCAHQKQTSFPQSLKEDMVAADKKCAGHDWKSVSEHMACYDAVEVPVIQNDVPEVLDAYNHFTVKRMILAQKVDRNLAEEIIKVNGYKQQAKDAGQQFKSLHPEFEDDDSALNKEITSTINGQCPKTSSYEKNKCAQKVTLPILQNEAPDSIEDFNDLMAKRLSVAKKLDTVENSKKVQKEIENFNDGMKNVKTEYLSDARNAFNAAAAENEISKQKADDDLKILGDVAAVVVVAAAVTVAVLAAKHGGGGGGTGGDCCKVCTIGKACGDTCITMSDICHVPIGCACNQY